MKIMVVVGGGGGSLVDKWLETTSFPSYVEVDRYTQ